ncbi:MAG: hypothetical protein ACK5SX_12365 [Sandaracinobacter sp.]
MSRRPGLSVVRTVFRGRPRYVVSDIAAGRHLSVSPAAYRLLAGLDGQRALGAVGTGAGLSGREIAQLVPRLQLAGLLAGEGPASAAPVGPIEGRALFLKRELVELGPWLPRIDRAMGWLFHPLAAVGWLGLALMALLLFVADDGVGDVSRWIAQFDAARLLALYLIFLALKLLHELGHALALWRMAAAEGLRVHSIRAGIALMLIMPFPFTNVSSAWRLQSKWRRAVVGVAGMYVESWIAIAAVLLWAVVDDPLLKSAAMQVATIAAATTLLFNLNPFGRMDGYYVLADLAESPNLMQRASTAAVSLAARLARVRPAAELPPLEPRLLAYWLGVLAYRLVVFAGLVWLAHATLDERLRAQSMDANPRQVYDAGMSDNCTCCFPNASPASCARRGSRMRWPQVLEKAGAGRSLRRTGLSLLIPVFTSETGNSMLFRGPCSVPRSAMLLKEK